MTPSPCWQAPRSPASIPTAWLMLRDADRATDAVQNALVRAWRDLPTLRDPDRFDAWLRRLLVNACIDEMRRTRRSRFDVDVTDLSDQPATADAVSRIADRDQLERGFRRLEPEERAVIVLHHYLDLPLPDVAATLGIPLGTAKSRLYRGLRLMRAALDADLATGPRDQRRTPSMTTDDLFDRAIADWLHADAGTACRTISGPSSSERACSDSARHGRASKGGSPCRPRLADPARLGWLLLIVLALIAVVGVVLTAWASAADRAPVRARCQRRRRLRAGRRHLPDPLRRTRSALAADQRPTYDFGGTFSLGHPARICAHPGRPHRRRGPAVGRSWSPASTARTSGLTGPVNGNCWSDWSPDGQPDRLQDATAEAVTGCSTSSMSRPECRAPSTSARPSGAVASRSGRPGDRLPGR